MFLIHNHHPYPVRRALRYVTPGFQNVFEYKIYMYTLYIILFESANYYRRTRNTNNYLFILTELRYKINTPQMASI